MTRTSGSESEPVARYADMMAAMGAEPRLRIMRLLIAAHPDGLVVGDIQAELSIPASTLSHHLDKLKHEGLITSERAGTFLRYRADTAALQALLGFLYAECCTRSQAIDPAAIVSCCGLEPEKEKQAWTPGKSRTSK